MTLSNQTKPHKNERPDGEWTAAIRGTLGVEQQHDALQDLARYQQVVAYNYLRRCRTHSETLSTLSNDEIAAMAEDHVYDFIEKLVQNDFELLEKYSEKGRFTAWSARVLMNAMATEMRKASWRKQVPMADIISSTCVDRRTLQPEELVIQKSTFAIIHRGLDALPERHRIALTRSLMDGESAQAVADDLETTQNAVNVLVYRAKKKMRTYLIAHGMDQTVMSHFV